MIVLVQWLQYKLYIERVLCKQHLIRKTQNVKIEFINENFHAAIIPPFPQYSFLIDIKQ